VKYTIEDKMIDWYDAGHHIVPNLYFIFSSFVNKWKYIATKRLVCAIRGCRIIHNQGGGGYLPEDCDEWHCSRCWAEGINHVVFSHEIFYDDTPLENVIQALKGK